MRTFEISVEACLLKDAKQGRCGLATTFSIDAASASSAKDLASEQTAELMKRAGFSTVNVGFFKSFAYLTNIFELNTQDVADRSYDGASFYVVTWWEAIRSILRHFRIRMFQAWRLVPLNNQPARGRMP